MQRIAIKSNGLESRMRQQAREGSLRGDRARGDSVHADTAIAPFHSQTARQSFHSGLGDGRGNDISRANGRVGGRDAKHRAGTFCCKPPSSAGHRAVQGAHQDDVDHRLPGARREFFGPGDEISGGVVDQDVEPAFLPDRIDHPLDSFQAADIAGDRMNRAVGLQFVGSAL